MREPSVWPTYLRFRTLQETLSDRYKVGAAPTAKQLQRHNDDTRRNVSMILRHFLWKISVASVHESSWLGRLIQAASGKDGGTGRPLGNRSGDRAKADCRA